MYIFGFGFFSPLTFIFWGGRGREGKGRGLGGGCARGARYGGLGENASVGSSVLIFEWFRVNKKK